MAASSLRRSLHGAGLLTATLTARWRHPHRDAHRAVAAGLLTAAAFAMTVSTETVSAMTVPTVTVSAAGLVALAAGTGPLV
jgi:hypothetical protein